MTESASKPKNSSKRETLISLVAQEGKSAEKKGKKKVESNNSKSLQKKRARQLKEQLEEARLTAALFGDKDAALQHKQLQLQFDQSNSVNGKNKKKRSKIVHDRSKTGSSSGGGGGGGGGAETDVELDALFAIDRTGDAGINKELNDGADNTDLATPVGVTTDSRSCDILNSDDKDDDDDDDSQQGSDKEKSAPAWVDEDDNDVQVNVFEKNSSRMRKLRTSLSEKDVLSGSDLQNRLRERYVNTAQTLARTDWADRAIASAKADDADDDTTSEMLVENSAQPMLRHARLKPHTITMIRCSNANKQDYGDCVVKVANFYHQENSGTSEQRPLLLTGGLDMKLRYFRVDAEQSEKVQGIQIPSLPIYSANFLGASNKVVISGRRPFFCIHDVESGQLQKVPEILNRHQYTQGNRRVSLEKSYTSPDGQTVAFAIDDGYIVLYNAITKTWIADLKVNGSVNTVTFGTSEDGSRQEILASGSDGEIYRWDLRNTSRCLDRFSNQDGTATTVMATSDRHLAVGSASGVVNLFSHSAVYNRASGSSVARKKSGLVPLIATHKEEQIAPIKSVLNLHTPISSIKFNDDGNLLAMASNDEKNQLRLLHVPTATVYSNWPSSYSTPLNKIFSMDFSPGSKYLAMGNDKGHCLLYRIEHYYSQE